MQGLVVVPDHVARIDPQPVVGVKQGIGPKPASGRNQKRGDPLAAANRITGPDDLAGGAVRVEAHNPRRSPTGARPRQPVPRRAAAPPARQIDVEDRNERDQSQEDDALRQIISVSLAERVGTDYTPKTRMTASRSQPRRSPYFRARQPGPNRSVTPEHDGDREPDTGANKTKGRAFAIGQWQPVSDRQRNGINPLEPCDPGPG